MIILYINLWLLSGFIGFYIWTKLLEKLTFGALLFSLLLGPISVLITPIILHIIGRIVISLINENELMKSTLESIHYSVASCQAGDGDDSTWEEAALYAEQLACEALEKLEGEK